MQLGPSQGQSKKLILEKLQRTRVVAALILSPLVEIGEPDKRRATTLSAVPVSKKKSMLEPLCED